MYLETLKKPVRVIGQFITREAQDFDLNMGLLAVLLEDGHLGVASRCIGILEGREYVAISRTYLAEITLTHLRIASSNLGLDEDIMMGVLSHRFEGRVPEVGRFLVNEAVRSLTNEGENDSSISRRIHSALKVYGLIDEIK